MGRVDIIVAGYRKKCGNRFFFPGIHPTAISESFQHAAEKSIEILEQIAIPISLNDREQLLKAASTPLNSKVVSQYADTLAPIAVDAVLKVIDINTSENADLRDVKVVKQHGSVTVVSGRMRSEFERF